VLGKFFSLLALDLSSKLHISFPSSVSRQLWVITKSFDKLFFRLLIRVVLPLPSIPSMLISNDIISILNAKKSPKFYKNGVL